jgi:ABC-type glycerol-3-phosphate transport system permease component
MDADRVLAARPRRLAALPARVLLHLLLAAIGVLFLLPFYWMLMSSLRPLADFYALPMPLVVTRPAFRNFMELFARASFGRGMLNTAFLSAVSVALQVFFCALAGYTFAKMRFRWREGLFLAVMATMMIPYGVRIIPSFMLMARIHWVDTYLPLIVPGIANAFGVFWMRQFCLSVPDELIDAAHIDGTGELGLFCRIIVPVITPALASLAIMVFLATWNDFLSPLVYLRSQERYTIQIWLSIVSRASNLFQPHLVMAGSVLSSIPVIILFACLQRYFVAGLTAGSIK